MPTIAMTIAVRYKANGHTRLICIAMWQSFKKSHVRMAVTLS